MKIRLRATNIRPENATLLYSLNLFKNKRLFWLLQIPATIGFFLFGFLFLLWAIWLRPDLAQALHAGVVIMLPDLLFLLLGVALSIVLHELVHGAFFWLFSHTRPRFGFRGGYAYASAPGWFFPRRQYLVIGLAPLVILSVVGMILVAFVPLEALAMLLVAMIVNASGSVGDLWIVSKVIRERRNIIVEDLGDGMNFYTVP
jgi:hypothetical protein